MSKDDVLGALQRSGYPFEIRLLHTFKEAGIDARAGVRINDFGAEETSREIDVLGSTEKKAIIELGGQTFEILLQVGFVTEAKAFGSDAGMVMFASDRPKEENISFMRSVFGGHPCCQIVGEVKGMTGLRNALGRHECLTGMSEAEYCVQYTMVRRGKDGQPFADHDTGNMWKGIDTTMRVSHAMAMRASRSSKRAAPIHIVWPVPILAVSAPLYSFDERRPEVERLREIDRAMLVKGFDVGGTNVVRIVDVVSERAFPAYLRTCLQAAAKLFDHMLFNAGSLIEFANKQSEEHAMAALRGAP